MLYLDRPIHIWVPGICEGSGGIQAFSRFFVQAVHHIFPNAPIRVFVKNDSLPEDDPLRALPVQFHSVSFVPESARTMAFLSLGLTLGVLDQPRLTLCTHVHFLPALVFLKGFTNARCVAVLHGIEAWNLQGKMRIHALRGADELIAVSHFTAAQVMDRFQVAPERIRVIPNTFDITRYSPGPKPKRLLEHFKLNEKTPVLLTVSRLLRSERYKGHRQVLAAMPVLLKRWPDLRYIIVGEGDEKEVLIEAVKAQGLEANVSFAGFVPSDELLDYYRLCDVFIMPSSKEGFGIVFLEAMACGKPVVAGNRDGSVDALDNGRLGSLIDPSDPAGIADAVSSLITHSASNALWFDPQQLADAVNQTFGPAAVTAQLKDVLRHLPKDKPVSTPVISCRNALSQKADESKHSRVVVVTQFTSPYHIELFNEVARQWKCQIDVIYLTDHDPARHWKRPLIGHPYLILNESAQMMRQARDAVANADVCIFNYYTHPSAQRLLRVRVRKKLPWCFWGERPGVLRLGPLGKWFRKIALRPLHQSQTTIWGIGKFGVERYQREFGHKRNYANIPYFSDLSRFRARELVEKNGNIKVFLYSGTLSRRKGADLVARAFAEVAHSRPNLRLLIMGCGRLEKSMRQDLQRVMHQVTWVGFQNWNALPEFYQKADFHCAPSRYDGWGLSIVEALASGLPVIGTDRTGSAIEFVRNDVNGWITSAGDCKALVNAMSKAADMTSKKQQAMSHAARESVREHTLSHGASRFTEAALQVLAQWEKVS